MVPTPDMLEEVAREHGVPTRLLAEALRLERSPNRRHVNTRLRKAVEDAAAAPVPGPPPEEDAALQPDVVTIQALHLHNFRNFRGEHAFEPGTTEARPLCLVEGPNGHGKSTLVLALLWALGADDEARGLAEIDRRHYPARLLHRDLPGAEARMAVEVVLHSTRLGRVVVRRSVDFQRGGRGALAWEPKAGTARHAVTWGRDETLQDRETAAWLAERFPRDLLRAFVFDAERSMLQELAGQLGESLPDVREQVEAFLGIATVRKAARRVEKEVVKGLRKKVVELDPAPRLQQARAGLERIDQERRKLTEALNATRRELRAATEEHRRLRDRIAKVRQDLGGYDDPDRRKAVLERRRRLEGEVARTREALLAQLRGPLLLAPFTDLLERRASEVQGRASPKEWAAGARKAARRIARQVAEGGFAWVREPPPDYESVYRELLACTGVNAGGSRDDAPLAQRLAVMAQRASAAASGLDPGLVGRLRVARRELEELDRSLSAAHPPPRELANTLARLVEEQVRLERRIAELKERIGEHRARLDTLQAEREQHARSLEEAKGRAAGHRSLRLQLERAEALHGALTRGLVGRLLDERLAQVERTASDMLRRLTNKPGQRDAIRFDRDTLRFRVVDRQGRPAPHDASTGERTVLAFSLVYGLQSVADLRLPGVVEAPLRPLDDVHTPRVVRELLGRPPHQLIVLEVPGRVDPQGIEVLTDVLATRWRLQGGPQGFTLARIARGVG